MHSSVEWPVCVFEPARSAHALGCGLGTHLCLACVPFTCPGKCISCTCTCFTRFLAIKRWGTGKWVEVRGLPRSRVGIRESRAAGLWPGESPTCCVTCCDSVPDRLDVRTSGYQRARVPEGRALLRKSNLWVCTSIVSDDHQGHHSHSTWAGHLDTAHRRGLAAAGSWTLTVE